MDLWGRRRECGVLADLVNAVRAGESRTLVVHGEAGIGKSALLDHAIAAATDLRVVRAVGVEAEMELAYASLHQLCAPMLDRITRLPVPQREALEVVFGLDSGHPPEMFLVGLAVLGLLSDAAEERPLLCVIDDAQWLDQASALTLAFVARRLLAEPVGLVFSTREPGEELEGLPDLEICGLKNGDARGMLATAVRSPLDDGVRDRIVAETHGNPLALLELPRSLTATQLAGGFGLLTAEPPRGRIEEAFARRLDSLPEHVRRLILIAAAEPVGDPLLLWRAAKQLGIVPAPLSSVDTDGLLTVGGRVTFRHPLVRSVVYRAAAIEERQAVHLALAEVTDPHADPDRRAWHRATAAAGPDESVAEELEQSAGRAQGRGGLAAAAAFLERAVALSANAARRTDRALAAAEASLQAGAFDAALSLLATAEAEPLDGFRRARVELLRGHVAFVSGLGSDAPPLLLSAARQLEPFDLDLARETYLTAWGAAIFAGAATSGVLEEICRSVVALPPASGAPRALDVLLEGLARLTTDGRAAATPILRRAVKALQSIPAEDVLRWGWAATGASDAVWDDASTRAISDRQVHVVREAGALAELPIHLAALGLATAWTGDLTGAASLVSEGESVAAVTGSPIAPYVSLRLRALSGDAAQGSALIASALEQAEAGKQGLAAAWAYWASAVLDNGLCRYKEAASAAHRAASSTFEPWASAWALPELAEAAARIGDSELATEACERLEQSTQPCGTDFAAGIEARTRALISEGADAESLYREAVERLGRTQLRPELARAHLLLGEWLRRENRRVEARAELRTAHSALVSMGMDAFAERARSELAATGEKVRKRTVETRDDLTPQERRIAEFARDGLSNPEIGSRLFLSPRTVEWHLHKVFTKLGVQSRRELTNLLAQSDSPSELIAT
jgi:DNA-binding CsgD family transcriptional regulator